MAKVILLCGKICVGKTTYAKELLRRSRAVYLNTDELMHRFYAGPCGAEYHAALARAQAYLLGVAADIVRAGLDVVYEGAAWLRSDRQAASAYFWKNGIEAQWHCVAATPETQRAFIEKRNREVLAGESGAAFVDDELFARCEENYEPPEPGEMDVVIQV